MKQNKRTLKLNESQLRKIIKESLNEIDYSNFDFSKTNGIDLSDTCYGFTPKEVKERLLALQNAINAVMDMMNGSGAGSAFTREMWDRCYDFYNFITQYLVELKQTHTNYEGTWEEDHSDIPFIRKYDDDYAIPNYYDRDGKQIDSKTFRSNFKPRTKKQ